MNIIYTDALIVGGGLAGMRTAIGIKRRGLDVIVLSLVPPKRSHSAAAQGGMQASLGHTFKGQGDDETTHFIDTVKGSDWGADQTVVRMFVETAPKAIRELAAWGVPWNRIQKGAHECIIDGQKTKIVERDDAHGLITARDFGGTKKWRTSYVSDGTGHSMLYNLSNQAIAEDITVHDRMEALSLLHDEGRCYGAIVRHLITGELICYIAKATCIATGGFGRVYRDTTNAVINEGIGTAIALETGVAALGNMEAVQFHPTGIFPASILVTEGCRGDGGLLLDKDGHRFMPDYEPEKKELASRDVVARCMETHIRSGKGVSHRFGEHLWLDIRLLGESHISSRLREVKEICQYFLGLNPAHSLIPVRPAQHYSMGGIRTDHTGQSPQLVGLFAVGEAACWDLHGFNRLGGNSLAETVVAGMIVGETMSDFLASPGANISVSTTFASNALQETEAQLRQCFDSKHTESAFEIMQAMQNVMSDKVGIFRHGDTLSSAVTELAQLSERAKRIKVHQNSKGVNPELVCAYRVKKMLKLSLCVATGALDRTESRGAHYREDYQVRNDRDWLKRTLATWQPGSEAPDIQYEPLKLQDMELPPGWRGYGKKNHIEHPDCQARVAQIEAFKRTVMSSDDQKNAMADKPQEILAFRRLLPEGLRQHNVRLDGQAE